MPPGCVTHRRCGQGVPWTPASPAGLLLWLKSSTQTFQDTGFATPAVADGDVIGGWKDQSGNGNHVLQATAANKPLLKLAQVNGKPSVRFDGVNDLLQALFTLDRPFDLFMVVKQIAWIDTKMIVSGGANDNFSVEQHSVTPHVELWNGTVLGADNGNLAAATWGLLEAGMPTGGGNAYLLVNNGSATTSGAPASSARGGITLAAHPTGPASWSNVEFAEIALYNAILGTTDAASFRTYIHNTYAFF